MGDGDELNPSHVTTASRLVHYDPYPSRNRTERFVDVEQDTAHSGLTVQKSDAGNVGTNLWYMSR